MNPPKCYYCNEFDQSVAEQRLGKQTATIKGKLCFLVVRAEQMHVAGQRSGKYTSTVLGDGVFRGVLEEELS
jgi:hypothetical protein